MCFVGDLLRSLPPSLFAPLFPRLLLLLLEQVGALLALSPRRAEVRMFSLTLSLSLSFSLSALPCLAWPGVRALSGSAGVDVDVSVDVCRVVVVVVLVLLLMLLSDVRVLCSLGASKLCCQLIFSN